MSLKILVTGANGLVGSAICRRFLQDGHQLFAFCRANSDKSLLKDIAPQITVLEGELSDISSLQEAIQQVDYVVHTAAVVSFAPRDQKKMLKTNVEGTANLVNVCLANPQIKKLCFISSVAALGKPSNIQKTDTQIEISENQKWEESPMNSYYAKTKYLAECEVWRGEAEGLNVVIVNPSVILGEGDWTRSSTQLFKYIHDKNKFYTLGSINYVDVKDVSEVVYKLTVSDIKGERFILNAGTTTYKEVFDKIADAMHKPHTKYLVTPLLAEIIWRIEHIRSFFTGNAPLITKETARSSRTVFAYKNNKIRKTLGFEFNSLDSTIKRVCQSIADN